MNLIPTGSERGILTSHYQYKMRILSISSLRGEGVKLLSSDSLVVMGFSNAGIAKNLHIAVGTVKTHVRNIMNKLSADDRTHAAVLALRSGLVA